MCKKHLTPNSSKKLILFWGEVSPFKGGKIDKYNLRQMFKIILNENQTAYES